MTLRASPWISIAALALVACARTTATAPASSAPGPVVVAQPSDTAGGKEDVAETCPNEKAPKAIVPEAPSGYEEMTVAAVQPASNGGTVVLIDASRKTGIAMFVGGSEAMSIRLRLENGKFTRPLTHDLLDAMLAKLAGRVVSARVDSIAGDVFIGTVVLQKGTEAIELDARASDAIALALGAHAPIYVARSVIDRSGMSAASLGLESVLDR